MIYITSNKSLYQPSPQPSFHNPCKPWMNAHHPALHTTIPYRPRALAILYAPIRFDPQ